MELRKGVRTFTSFGPSAGDAVSAHSGPLAKIKQFGFGTKDKELGTLASFASTACVHGFSPGIITKVDLTKAIQLVILVDKPQSKAREAFFPSRRNCSPPFPQSNTVGCPLSSSWTH